MSPPPANGAGAPGQTEQGTTLKEKQPSYLSQLESLADTYLALDGFLKRIRGKNDEGRALVESAHLQRLGCLPGRCVLLEFGDSKVEKQDIDSPAKLDKIFEDRALQKNKTRHSLFILEDLEPGWVNTLAGHLDVDPFVFCEQINTWNFTDSRTNPSSALPSAVKPETSFTMRYYECRQLTDPHTISSQRNQMTFAINRRRYERWRDADTALTKNKWRHAFVRRCASFWTNQSRDKPGWDAVILVDPPFDHFDWQGPETPQNGSNHTKSSSPSGPAACTILQDPTTYSTRSDLWDARAWNQPGSVQLTADSSVPYHGGTCILSAVGPRSVTNVPEQSNPSSPARRNLTSPLDELVFHWTQVADGSLIASARSTAANAAHFLLQYVATAWTDQLELVACSVALGEYLADDHQAQVDAEDNTANDWKAQIEHITLATRELNYVKRQLTSFELAATQNLTRLGIDPGAAAAGLSPSASDDAAKTIRSARVDFAAIHARLTALSKRIATLSAVADDLANIHTGVRNVKDSKFALRLSIFASIIFPTSLVSSMFSMEGRFHPGEDLFWVYFVLSIPLVGLFAFGLLYGQKPERFLRARWARVVQSWQRPKATNPV